MLSFQRLKLRLKKKTNAKTSQEQGVQIYIYLKKKIHPTFALKGTTEKANANTLLQTTVTIVKHLLGFACV